MLQVFFSVLCSSGERDTVGNLIVLPYAVPPFSLLALVFNIGTYCSTKRRLSQHRVIAQLPGFCTVFVNCPQCLHPRTESMVPENDLCKSRIPLCLSI